MPTHLTDRKSDTLTVESDPLKLDLKDDVLIRVIDKRISQSERYFNDEKNLKERRRKNKNYLFGRQLDLNKLKDFQARYIDNIPYEAEGTIKPIALSRLPDMVVTPSKDDEESKKTAKTLTSVLNSNLRKREIRSVLGLAFKHNPVYFVGIIKAIWDPEKGEDGDYRFKVVHPENVVVDHTATTNNPDDMDFIAEATEMSIKEVLMHFPDKEKKLLKELENTGKIKAGGKEDEVAMASKIKIWEVWFTWWENATDPETGKKRWERIEGVVWKYKDLLLGKMKNPYWDWEGERRLITHDLGEKRELSDEETRNALFGGLAGEEDGNVEQEQFFNNFFKNPRKPYIFLNYDVWGEQPYDETSRIEQILYMQDNINKRGRQITEINDRSAGKNIFSTESGLTKEDVRDMDMQNFNEDVMVEGPINETYLHITGPQANPAMFKEQESERDKAFAKMGTRATTRGERGGQETATGRQILREQDFGRIDDIVEETINHAAEQMSQWSMQFIKLFYTNEHMERLQGIDGSIAFEKISRDSVEDGMEVLVSASGVDKIQKKREAFNKAELQLIDPLTFFIDTDSSDPKGRTEKLITFISSPELYLQKYVLDKDTGQIANDLQQQPIGGQEGGVPTEQAAELFAPAIQTAIQPAAGGGGMIDPKQERLSNFTSNFGGGGHTGRYSV